MFTEAEHNDQYPLLAKLSNPIKTPEREIVGREHEKMQLLASMARPELCNAILLGPAGTGKTALVQATSDFDSERLYLEVDPARMIADAGDADQMASHLKSLFDEAERFVAVEDQELVLFIDEFHQIVQLSDAAVEAIKPVLAASGSRGIRVIAATTYEEFHKHISPNQPLVERLQRINLNPPDEESTVKILRGMAERYGVGDQFHDDHLLHKIYEYTERYNPASVQPRKSILVLDSMVGWHTITGRPMDHELLADVLEESVGVRVVHTMDGSQIKNDLDKQVFSQDYATLAMAKRLHLIVAELHDQTRPLGSFLLTGSSGVGKTELTKQLARLRFGDDQRHLIRFDMSEFATENSLDLFRSELTRRVWDLSHSVVLLDEIEKAHRSVSRLLLQVLDDGRLSDDNNRTVSFINTYMVLTTNAGSEIYEQIARYEVDDEGSGKKLQEYQRLIEKSLRDTESFPAELLGRIDAIVPFQPLSRKTKEKIVLRKLKDLVTDVTARHNVHVAMDQKVLQYLIEDKSDTESNSGGARDAVRRMTDEVTTEIARFLNEHPVERRIRVDMAGVLVSDDKFSRISDAHVEVSADRR